MTSNCLFGLSSDSYWQSTRHLYFRYYLQVACWFRFADARSRVSSCQLWSSCRLLPVNGPCSSPPDVAAPSAHVSGSFQISPCAGRPFRAAVTRLSPSSGVATSRAASSHTPRRLRCRHRRLTSSGSSVCLYRQPEVTKLLPV